MLGHFSIGGRRVLVTGLACLAAAGALAGCGSSSSTNASTNQVVRAAYVSTNTSGYRMRFGMVLSSSALPQAIRAVGSGRFNVQQHSGAITLAMDFGSVPQIQSVLGSSTFVMRELINGTTIYIRLPDALTGRLPQLSGKPWLKVDLAKIAGSSGVPGIGSLLNNPASGDPSQFLTYLRAAGTVTKVGGETVNGIATTHYRAVIDLDKVSSALPASSRSQVQSAIAGLEKTTNLHQIPVGVWVDSHNLVRRIRMAFRESLASGQSVAIAITIDIVDYGPQPPAVPPPADQVSDVSSLTGTGATG
jgi:hypothetical protein